MNHLSISDRDYLMKYYKIWHGRTVGVQTIIHIYPTFLKTMVTQATFL